MPSARNPLPTPPIVPPFTSHASRWAALPTFLDQAVEAIAGTEKLNRNAKVLPKPETRVVLKKLKTDASTCTVALPPHTHTHTHTCA